MLNKYAIPVIILFISIFGWASACPHIYSTNKGKMPARRRQAELGWPGDKHRHWLRDAEALDGDPGATAGERCYGNAEEQLYTLRVLLVGRPRGRVTIREGASQRGFLDCAEPLSQRPSEAARQR